MAQTYHPGRPLPVEFEPDEGQHRRMLARVLQQAMNGKTNNALTVTLEPSVATTTITDSRISSFSAIHFTPQTADAAAELGAGTMYCVPAAGSAVIHHANNSQTDRVFKVSLNG